MSLERLEALHRRLLAAGGEPVLGGDTSATAARPELAPGVGLSLFESQLLARHLDRVAHELRARGEGFYTISSAGHEGNVVLGRLLRVTDPAMLHYRSAGFFVERARQHPSFDPVDAVTLGLTASSEDPIAGGRHKVFGSLELCVLPQTSTIASHLPKALGLAFAIERARRLGRDAVVAGHTLPADAVVLCTLGDASLNHASATVALNAARWVAHQGLPLPLLVVCEDNGIGLSVRSPRGWVERVLGGDTEVRCFGARGWDLPETYAVAAAAVEHCRSTRRPTLLHLRCARLLGHSGADPDTVYRSRRELEDAAELDPLLGSARWLVRSGLLDASSLADLDARLAARVNASAARAVARPKLQSAAEVMAPLVGAAPEAVAREARRADYGAARLSAFGSEQALPEAQGPLPLGRALNLGLHDLMAKYPELLVFGEDVAQKGGVYNVTAGLWKRFGAGRVFNTLLDETTILGLAQGAALAGLLPAPEIQYLAFLHNAEDQLRGEAASTRFFSRGQLSCPTVVRIASFGYQRGFGGHFHNDNSIAVLRDIPGLLVAAPSNGRDAVGMLRTCFAAARVEGRVVAFLEPIALYVVRDLHPGDGAWASAFPEPGFAIDVGEVGVYRPEAGDLTIATYANGVPMALRAADELERAHGLSARVVDLRWLAPLPLAPVLEQGRDTGRLLVLDECRRAGNVGEALVAHAACEAPSLELGLVTAKESFVPLGDAANLVLPSEAEVVSAALALCR